MLSHARFRSFGVFLTAALSLAATAAWAGPPFVTDDPEPTDTGHWEVYSYISGSHVTGETAGEGGFDLNYGPVKDLQLTATLPLAYAHDDRTHIGWGDLELGAKYRFLHQAEGSAMPDVAVFPRLIFPTSGRRFGSGRLQVLLPAWGQKDFGPWSVFGGGGYDINPGAGNRNFWVSGLAATRAISKRLALGAEVYHQTADTVDGKPYTGVNLGALYKLGGPWSLIAAGGPGVQNAREGGRYSFYAALKLDY